MTRLKPLREQEPSVADEVREILDEATPIKTDRDAVRERRRHFAFGLFFVSIFMIGLAAILPSEDRWLWGGASFIYLLVAAWCWDRERPAKSSKT